MKREFLTNLGLETEQVNSIMAEHGKAINSYKEDAEKYQGEVKELEEQLKGRDKQLEELSQQAKGNEQFEAQIKELQQANEQTAQEYQAKLDKQAFDFALDKAVMSAGAKNPKAVKALLDVENIKLDGDKLLGFDEQVNTLKESDDYLFGVDEPKSLKGREPVVNDKSTASVTKDEFKKMSYPERVQLYNEKPDLYKKLSE